MRMSEFFLDPSLAVRELPFLLLPFAVDLDTVER